MRQSIKTPLLSVTALLLYIGLYQILRLPTKELALVFYDDGELLYHVLSILSGRVPYRDDISHHFLGYALPLVLLAKLVGFGPHLAQQMALISQPLSAFFIFQSLRYYAPNWPAFIGGLLLLCARQPAVFGYPVQYELNMLITLIFWLALAAVRKNNNLTNFHLGIWCGLLVVFDQRMLLIATIPTLVSILNRNLYSLISFWVAPTLAASYLVINQAWHSFVEQTFVFPIFYRVGSLSLIDQLALGFSSLRYLFTLTPFLCLSALFALFLLPRKSCNSSAVLLPLAIIITIAPHTFLGGRDFDYYSIVWLPTLSFLAALGLHKASSIHKRLYYKIGLILVSGATLIPLSWSVVDYLRTKSSIYNGDGAAEVANYLNMNLTSKETVFVWGYRPDIYVLSERLSPYPFMNLLLAQADNKIGIKDQERHKYPKYAKQLADLLRTSPPDYLVFFNRSGLIRPNSELNKLVLDLVKNNFTKVFETMKKDLQGELVTLSVFKLSTSNSLQTYSESAHPH